jgi:hypothetical protein
MEIMLGIWFVSGVSVVGVSSPRASSVASAQCLGLALRSTT